jgi:hypothetical protein
MPALLPTGVAGLHDLKLDLEWFLKHIIRHQHLYRCEAFLTFTDVSVHVSILQSIYKDVYIEALFLGFSLFLGFGAKKAIEKLYSHQTSLSH